MTLLELCSFVFLCACVAAAATFGAQWLGWPGGVLGAFAAVAAIYGFIRFSMAMKENSPRLTQSTPTLEFICFCLIVVLLAAASVIWLYSCSRHIGFAALLLAPFVLLGAMPVSWILAGDVTSLVLSGSVGRRVLAISVAITIFVVSSMVLAMLLLNAARGGSAAPTAVTITQDGQQWTLATQLNPGGTRIAVIEDSSGKVAFTGAMRFSEHSRWFVYGGDGEFWIYSSDIGTLYYARAANGSWEEFTGPQVPASVKMPRDFYSQLPDSSRKHVDQNSVGP